MIFALCPCSAKSAEFPPSNSLLYRTMWRVMPTVLFSCVFVYYLPPPKPTFLDHIQFLCCFTFHKYSKNTTGASLYFHNRDKLLIQKIRKFDGNTPILFYPHLRTQLTLFLQSSKRITRAFNCVFSALKATTHHVNMALGPACF